MIALGVVLDEQSDVAVRDALADIEASVMPHRAGEYPNFVELPTDASRFFEPAVWEPLREIKSRYDAGDLFVGNHRIPPAERA